MRQRCENHRDTGYMNYGGRGVTVCERWRAFENFYADMGPRPTPKHSIDRIDNDGNYEPGNCRWATKREQVCNRRGSLIVTFRGERQPLGKLCADAGLRFNVVYGRLKLGWTVDRALSTPPKR